MSGKPKNWDLLSSVEQEAWRVKNREANRKWREVNPEKARESQRKYHEANPEKKREQSLKSYYKAKQQTAADQFFIMAGAAEQLTKLKPKQ